MSQEQYPLGASRRASLSVSIRKLIYAYIDFKFLVTKINALNWYERKSLMNTEENQGFLLRGSAHRKLSLYFNYGHWRISRPIGKEVNKVPPVAIPLQSLKPFIN